MASLTLAQDDHVIQAFTALGNGARSHRRSRGLSAGSWRGCTARASLRNRCPFRDTREQRDSRPGHGETFAGYTHRKARELAEREQDAVAPDWQSSRDCFRAARAELKAHLAECDAIAEPEEVARTQARRRRDIDECKARIARNYRSGEHWFKPDIYQKAKAELEAEKAASAVIKH